MALLPLICVLLFGKSNQTYQNELIRYNTLSLSKSKYNFDGYNDFVDEANKYYNAFLEYVDFNYYTTIKLTKNETYSHHNSSLFYLENQITLYKNGYSLSIGLDKNYRKIELITSKKFYFYYSNEFLDYRYGNTIYFIKDRYRLCIKEDRVQSILSYKDNLYYKEGLYKINNNELISIVDIEKEKELKAISNIYLTEYF